MKPTGHKWAWAAIGCIVRNAGEHGEGLSRFPSAMRAGPPASGPAGLWSDMLEPPEGGSGLVPAVRQGTRSRPRPTGGRGRSAAGRPARMDAKHGDDSQDRARTHREGDGPMARAQPKAPSARLSGSIRGFPRPSGVED